MSAQPKAWFRIIEGADVRDVRRQRFRDTLFLNEKLEKVTNTVFERCSFQGCQFDPHTLNDMLGVTLTLDCFTFDGLEMNEVAFDALLYLITMTRGNDRKRELLRELIDINHRVDFDALFETATRK